MQQRRGTATQWTTANPILAAGEIGFESGTNKFKIGDGVNTWSALTYYASAAEIAALVDGAPDLLNTLNELAAAIGDDANFGTAIEASINTSVDESTAFATAAINTHAIDTTNIHGIANTALLALKSEVSDVAAAATLEASTAQSAAIASAAGTADTKIGVHNSDTTNVHGIADTAVLATATTVATAKSEAIAAAATDATNKVATGKSQAIAAAATASESYSDASITTHNNDTTAVHGIADTSLLATTAATTTAISTAVAAHEADTTNVHGIADTALLATKVYADGKASDAQSAATSAAATAAGSALSTHNSATTNVHGIADTALLATKTYADNAASTAVAAVVASAPATLDTLNEIAIALTADEGTAATLATLVGTKAPIASPTFTGTVSGITKSMVGLGSVDNTADSAKPVSTAQQTALDAKAPLASPALTGTPTAPTASAADNSTKIATTAYADRAASNAASALVASAPAALDTLNELASALGNDASFSTTITNSLAAKAPLASPTFTGTVSGITKSMVGLDSVDNTADTAKPISTATQTALDLKLASATAASTYAPLAGPTFTGTVSGITKSMVGLANVDNTADSAKPVSTATQTALDLKLASATAASTYAPLASPALTGVPTAPTAAVATNTTQVATTAYVRGEVAALVASAPAALDTLNELATALGNDASFSTTVTNSLALKAPLASPTFTGTVTVAAAGVAFTDGTQTKEGVASRTPIVQKTASYTLSALTERDSLIEVSSASGTTITIPTNTAVAYPIGTSIDILQTGAGQVTIAPVDGTVTVNSTPGLKLRTQWSSATLFKRAANTWVVFGDLTA